MIKSIEITFAAPVEFPDGFEQALSMFIGMICEKYQRDNPERVMWPSGHGSRPIWSMGDIAGYEEEVYSIDCAEREDSYGDNPFKPRRAALKQAAKAEREARKRSKV
mgnify:FL=1